MAVHDGRCGLCGYWHEWNKPCVVPGDDAAVVAAYRGQAVCPPAPPPPRPRPADRRGLFVNAAGAGYAFVFDEAGPIDWNLAQAVIRAARISHAVQDALQEYLGRGLWLDMLSAHEADPQGMVYCSRCWPFVQAIRARYRALVDAGAV